MLQGYCCSIMTLKCASDSVDNTDLPCTHLVLLYEKFAVQCPIEKVSIEKGRQWIRVAGNNGVV